MLSLNFKLNTARTFLVQTLNPSVQSMSPMKQWWMAIGWKSDVKQSLAKTENYR